jgi:hypothetical protein
MKIVISYESSWRNSFLDGSNNEPLPSIGRKFVGSMTELRASENYIQRNITLDTVMGILNRLIGDQRKLYQSREQDSYYFEFLEPNISFEDKPSYINQEVTYIRNVSGSTDKNSYTGMINAMHPMLNSDFSNELWGVLYLTMEELINFINNENFLVDYRGELDPIGISNRIKYIEDGRKIENIGFVKDAINFLDCHFVEIKTDKLNTPFIEPDEKIKPIRLYSAALYIQLSRLAEKFDMKNSVTKAGKVAGFSKRGFNGKRDFIKNFVTGGEKKIWGNPYIRKEKIKGIGEVVSLMQKAGGILNINLNIDREQAIDLKEKIDNAGVSSFYLGKKGLAYVSDLRV